MAVWKQEVKQEIEFLGNVAWSSEQSLEKIHRSTTVSAASSTLTTASTTSTQNKFNFPMEEPVELEAFEAELRNEECFEKWLKHFVAQIKFKSTLYSRRKALKELMFTE